MDPLLISQAFRDEAGSLPALAGLAAHAGQDSATLTPPCIVFQTETEKLFSSGRNGIFRVAAIVKSMVADSETHPARVELVRAAFSDNRAARISSINGRGLVRLTYAAILAKNEVIDGRLVTTLFFRAVAAMI